MNPKDTQPIDPMTVQHPLEPLQEASMMVNKNGHDNTGNLLEAIIQQNEKNNPEPAIEAGTIQSKRNTDKIVEAINSKPEVQQVKIITDESELADNFFRMLRGQKGYTPEKGKDYFTDQEIEDFKKNVTPIKGKEYFTDVEISSFKKEVTPVKGKDYFDGKDGYTPKKGIDYKDGKDGKDAEPVDERLIISQIQKSIKVPKDGKDGKNGKDAKDVTPKFVKEVTDKLKKYDEQNLLWVNNGAIKEVEHDSTLSGKGTHEDPLKVIGGGMSTVHTDATLTGDGSFLNPLHAVGDGIGDMLKATYDPAGGNRQVAFLNQLPDVSDMATKTWVGSQGFVTGTPWTAMGYVTGTPWTSAGYLTDAPSDGSTYGRKNGVWSAFSGGSMVYPSSGIPISTGSAWGTSITDNSANWNTAYTNRITSLTTTGSSGSATLSSNTLNIPTYTLAGLGGISLASLSATSPLSYNNGTGAFSIQVANTSQGGYLSSTDWNTFNNKLSSLFGALLSAGVTTGATVQSQTFTNGVTLSNLTASQLVATDASKNLQSLAVATYPSLTELSYIKGLTSAIQTQLNGKQASGSYQPLNTNLTSIGGLANASGFLKNDGSGGFSYAAAGAGDMILNAIQTVTGAKTFNDGKLLLRNVADTFSSAFTNTNTAARTYTLKDASGTLAFTSDIPSVGTWGALNYPTWSSGTPFVKMTAAGTFALDTNTYLTSLSGALLATGATTGATSQAQAFTNNVLVGSDASLTDFPLAKFISSQSNTGHTFPGNIGVVGEATSGGGSTYGVGVGGVVLTDATNIGVGVYGRAKVGATGYTGDARGIQGTSVETHAGGSNIGIYSNASGGATNYSFYGFAGTLYNAETVNFGSLTASKLVFTDASKNLTSTGIGTSSQFIKGDGSLDSSTYLTSASTLDASKLSGTIPTGVLGNSSLYIGTTSVALNRASAALALTGITSIDGTATNLSGTPALPNGTTATTQSANDNSTKLATTAYVDAQPASALKSATTTVNVSSATAPSTGQILTATDSTHATWQTPAGGGEWTYLSKVTWSNEIATKTFSSLTTHDTWKIVIRLMSIDSASAPSITLRINNITSNAYSYTLISNTTVTTSQQATTSIVLISLPDARAGLNIEGEVVISGRVNSNVATYQKSVSATYISSGTNYGNDSVLKKGGIAGDNNDVNRLDIANVGENMTGTVELWYKDAK